MYSANVSQWEVCFALFPARPTQTQSTLDTASCRSERDYESVTMRA